MDRKFIKNVNFYGQLIRDQITSKGNALSQTET